MLPRTACGALPVRVRVERPVRPQGATRDHELSRMCAEELWLNLKSTHGHRLAAFTSQPSPCDALGTFELLESLAVGISPRSKSVRTASVNYGCGGARA